MLRRLVFLACALALPIFALLTAPGCSSDDPGSPDPDSGAQSSSGSSGDTTDSSTSKRDTSTDGPTGPIVMCSIGGAVENEPNDTPATATPFTALTFCGVLSSGTDVDYSTFDTPEGTKLGVFQGVIDGKVQFTLTLNGQEFGPEATTKFGSGTYLVKAFTSAGQPASYNYRVQFDPN